MIGLDISPEGEAEPMAGCYDRYYSMDICKDLPDIKADLVISRPVFEHLRDSRAAAMNCHGLLRPGGRTLHLIPCRFALPCIANQCLGPGIGKRLKRLIHGKERYYRAYYDSCTPKSMGAVFAGTGFTNVSCTPSYCNDYLRMFAPAYVLDVLRQCAMKMLGEDSFCDAFMVYAEKKA